VHIILGAARKMLCPKAVKGLAQSLHKLFFVIPQMPKKAFVPYRYTCLAWRSASSTTNK